MILIPPSIMSPLLYVIWIGVCGGNQDAHRCAVPKSGGGGASFISLYGYLLVVFFGFHQVVILEPVAV